VKTVTSLQFEVFLASAAGTFSLQEHVVSSCTCPIHSFLDSYLTDWSSYIIWYASRSNLLPGRQSFWDQPRLQADRSVIEASMVEPSQMARYLAPHSGDWLLALLIASCGLRLEEEAVRVAVGMRLGLDLCVPTDASAGPTYRRPRPSCYGLQESTW